MIAKEAGASGESLQDNPMRPLLLRSLQRHLINDEHFTGCDFSLDIRPDRREIVFYPLDIAAEDKRGLTLRCSGYAA